MAWWPFRRNRREQDLEEELAHDLAAEADEGVRAGLSPEEAARASRRQFGNLLAVKERVRDTWGWGRTERFWQDVRYGLRSMRRTPGVTAVIVVTLMLGIGANAVVFSVVNAVLLRPLPYRDPTRLVFVTGHQMRFARFFFFDGSELNDWRARSASFESMAGYFAVRDTCTTGVDAFDAGIAYIQGDMTRLLGVSPAIGRDFLSDEVRPAAGQSPRLVALISDGVFREHLGGDATSIGKIVLTINKVPYLVIGVLPRDLRLALPGIGNRGPTGPDASPLFGIDVVVNRDAVQATGPTQVLGRLKHDVRPDAAQAEISTLHARYLEQHPDRPKSDVRMMPLQDRVVGDTRFALLTLWATVGFVLFVACANVTNLLLARSTARGREIAVRAALGATRGRLVRQLLTESISLAFAGGIAGVAVAFWAIRLIVTKIAIDIPRIKEASLDWNVLLFCAALCTGTGILAGLTPALSGSRRHLGEMMGRERNAASVSADRHRVHGLLVIAQLAIALVLLTGAGLMLKSLWLIRLQTEVFAPEHVLETNINARQIAQPDFYLGELPNQIEALPGVQAAAAFTTAGRPLGIVGLPAPAANQTLMTIVRITPHYKAAAGVRLVSGRWLSDEDLRGAPRVTVVNESLMRIVAALYPDSGPILGRQIDLGGKASDNPTVVGVVSALQRRPDAEPEPQMFVPSSWWPLNGIAQYLVRVAGDPMTLAGPIQKIVGRTPRVEMRGTQTAEDELLSGLAPRRFQTTLLVTFAGLALLLAMAGAYGVLSYGVTERTHEIGVRVAIGAQRMDVLLMVLGRAARLAGMGIGIGVIASASLSRLIASLLYGVRPSDPWTYAATGLVLFFVAILAAYLPARRAMRVDPAVALRYE